jgi:hypothetical protein
MLIYKTMIKQKREPDVKAYILNLSTHAIDSSQMYVENIHIQMNNKHEK